MNLYGLSIVDWVQILSALGTLIAAIAAWKSAIAAKTSSRITSEQLEEMRQQRIDQIRPYVHISDAGYSLNFNPENGYGSFCNEAVQEPKLVVTNIGVGHAKKLNFKWFFDMENSIRLIQTYEIGQRKIYKYVPDFELSTENGVTFLKSDLKNYFPILLKDKEYPLSFPFSYLEILSFLYHLLLEEHLDLKVVPNLNLEIEYMDTFEQKVSRNFIIIPKLIKTIASEEDGKLTDYSFKINFQVDEISSTF